MWYISKYNEEDDTNTCEPKKISICALCEKTKPITKHHLTTKADPYSKTAKLCLDCHKFVHKTFKLKEIIMLYNTIEKIKENEKIQKYLNERVV